MWYSEHDTPPPEAHVYRRSLPSGGYVAITTQTVQPLFAETKVRGYVVVERRGESRRQGHPAPIVAIAERQDVESLVAALMPVAESDELIAEPLQRRVTIPLTSRRQLPQA